MEKFYTDDIAKSPRIDRLKDALFAKAPEIEVERAVLLTESYKNTEGLPTIARRAKAFRHILENLPITINEDELIVAGVKPLPAHQKIVDGKLEEKTVREMWLEGSISTEDFAKHKRRERDSLLTSTDKYMISDFPVDEAYRERIRLYRQELRDITQSAEWPDVEIPQVPQA